MDKPLTIALVGLETIRNDDGSIKHFSETFLNNIRTYIKENPSENVVIIDARDLREIVSPMGGVWARLGSHTEKSPAKKIIYSGHSGTDELYMFSRYRKELPDGDRYFMKTDLWEGICFAEGAEIRLLGCQTTGQNGKRFDDCIAQSIANATKVPTWGYPWKTSQKKRGGGYYQVPDRPDIVKCVPVCP